MSDRDGPSLFFVFFFIVALSVLLGWSIWESKMAVKELRSEQMALRVAVQQFLYVAETYEMYNVSLRETAFIAGKYESDGYACVWLSGRTPEEVNMTWGEEYCHHLVYGDWQHYCEDSPRK